MFPTKKRFFCVDCNKPKILFESKKKAIRFMEFNGDEIEAHSGKRPVRAYYCIACGGWHTTSHEKAPAGHSHIERYFYKQDKLKFLRNRINASLGTNKTLEKFLRGKVHEFRMQVMKKLINVEICAGMLRQLISLFNDIYRADLITAPIRILFDSFEKLCQKYIVKIEHL